VQSCCVRVSAAVFYESWQLLKIFYSISPAVTDSHLAPMGNVTVQSGSNLTRLQTVITNKTTIHSICDILSAFTKFPLAMEPKSSYTTVFKRAHHYPYATETSPHCTCYRSFNCVIQSCYPDTKCYLSFPYQIQHLFWLDMLKKKGLWL
jgi:hypothetical protein